MKYSLKDSYLFDIMGLDRITNDIATKISPKLDTFRVTEDQLSQIRSDLKSKASGSGKEKVLNRIDTGKIIFINAPGIPLPAWCMGGANGEVVAICNIYGKSRVDRNGALTYQVKELFGLAVVAYVLRSFYVNERKFVYNNQLVTNMGLIYARMNMRVLDSLFAINAMGNELESNLIEFLLAKFYLRRIMEKESTNAQEVTNIGAIMTKLRTAKSAHTVHTDSFLDKAESFPDSAFESIDSLFKAMATSISSLSRLETNVFIRKLIMTLGEKSALMLESPHYLYAYTVSSAYNTNLIKDYQMSTIASQDLLSKVAHEVFALDPEG